MDIRLYQSYFYLSYASTTAVTEPPKSLLDSVSNICEAVSTDYLLSLYEYNYLNLSGQRFFHFDNLNFLFQVQEIGDITLTLTTPDDLKPLATQEASRIAARLNLIEKAINDLETPKCD